METLYSLFEPVKGSDEFISFRDFFTSNRKCIENWFVTFFKKINVKNAEEAASLKTHGNECYYKKQFDSALNFYKRALCSAPTEDEVYFLILSNISAVFFMLEDYGSCLNAIEMYSNSRNGTDSYKIILRRIKCYYHLDMQTELDKTICDILDSNISDIEKEKLSSEITHFRDCNNKSIGDEKKFLDEIKSLPSIHSRNANFCSASSNIKLCSNEAVGRYVVASENIKAGEILFIEKALFFAPVFHETDAKFSLERCYHCLKFTRNILPCKYCSLSIFCSEDCLQASWNNFHQWECEGLQLNLWYHTGIAFPAFRGLIKGIPSGFSYENANGTERFGHENDNYPYFNTLLSNISKMQNITPILIVATLIIIYIKRCTKLIDHVMNCLQSPTRNLEDLLHFLGGVVVRHIAQLQCNASLILLENKSVFYPYACAVYPSISMMNHSCCSNIAISYVEDTAIVKAAKFIKVGEEIFNCYGIDYRYMEFKARQQELMDRYYFVCECKVCKSKN